MAASLHTVEGAPPTERDCSKPAIVSLLFRSRVSSIVWSTSWLVLIAVLSGNLGAYEHSVMVAAKVMGYLGHSSPRCVGAVGGLQDALLCIRKPGHVFLYAVLAWSLRNCLCTAMEWPRTRSWIVVLVLCTGCAAADEMHQAMLPSRTALLSDVVLDVLASATTLLFRRAFERG